MGGLNGIMGNLGLFGGGGQFGGAIGGVFAAMLKMLYFVVTAGQTPVLDAEAQINGIAGQVGVTASSHLAGGLNTALYPEVSEWLTPQLQAEWAKANYRANVERATEVANIATRATKALPGVALQLGALEALNASPAGMTAAIQTGASANIIAAKQLADVTSLLAESNQLAADEATARAWGKSQAVDQAKAFFGEVPQGRLTLQTTTFKMPR